MGSERDGMALLAKVSWESSRPVCFFTGFLSGVMCYISIDSSVME